MVGAAQADRAGRDASSGPSGCHHNLGNWPVCSDPVSGAICWSYVVPINVRDAGEVERAITAFARSPTGGLIVTSSARVAAHADLIVALAARYRLPAVYYRRSFAAAGGLISYGADTVELARLAAAYADRILKGEKPADLPVQAPTKYELVINLKTAKALGLTVPPSLLARADEVIE